MPNKSPPRSNLITKAFYAFSALFITFFLAACGGGGGGGSSGTDLTQSSSFKWSGWDNANNLIQSRVAAGSLTITSQVIIADYTNPPYHGPAVSATFEQVNFGNSPTLIAADGESGFGIGQVQASAPYDAIINRSGLDHFTTLAAAFNWRVSVLATTEQILVIAAGNNSSQTNPSGTDTAAFTTALSTGRVVYAGGLSGTTLHSGSTPCGPNVMNYCLLAPFVVTINGQVYMGTSGSAPQVAAAIEGLRFLWPALSSQKQVSVLIATAIDICDAGVDSRCGVGMLSYENLFSPSGELTLNPSSSGFHSLGTSGSVEQGGLFLPGGNFSSFNLSGYDDFGRDFGLLQSYGNLQAEKSFLSTDFHRARGFGFSYSSEGQFAAIVAFQKDGSGLLFAESQVGYYCKSCNGYISISEDEKFFGGYGTGSFAFGTSRYLNLFGQKSFYDSGNLSVDGNIGLSYGKADDGQLIKDLSGLIIQPSLSFNKQLGDNGDINLEFSGYVFRGQMKLAGQQSKLNQKDAQVGLTYELAF